MQEIGKCISAITENNLPVSETVRGSAKGKRGLVLKHFSVGIVCRSSLLHVLLVFKIAANSTSRLVVVVVVVVHVIILIIGLIVIPREHWIQRITFAAETNMWRDVAAGRTHRHTQTPSTTISSPLAKRRRR